MRVTVKGVIARAKGAPVEAIGPVVERARARSLGSGDLVRIRQRVAG